MSSQEMYFSTQSRYPKVSKTAMPVDEVEAWLNQFPQKRAENKPNGGIIRSVADIDQLFLREMSPRERKVARAKAQREHKQALKNLAKQNEQDAKKIARQLTEWKKEDRKAGPKEPSQKLQWFLDEIQKKGFYEISDFDLSKVYLQKLVRAARKLGYKIKPVRNSRTIVQYILVNKKA